MSPRVRAVVIGGSAGALAPLRLVLRALPPDFHVPVLAVVHLHPSDGGRMAAHLQHDCPRPVSVAQDKQPVLPGQVVLAPADYHLLVERSGELALSVDPKVRWSRPSIDVLFDSAARAWEASLVAVLLSGASDDGARGLAAVHHHGGRCIVQAPATAENPLMPQQALERVPTAEQLSPDAIAAALAGLDHQEQAP